MTKLMEEMTWVEFNEARKRNDTILIPTGSVEVEGPHLPLNVDSLVALGTAKRVAEKTGLLVAPLLNVGYSEWHMGFPGTLSLEMNTVSQILRQISYSLIDYGFQRLVFINSHVGNDWSITELANEITRKRVARVAMINLWALGNEMAKNIPELVEKKFLHAGEIMTSVVMALRPDLVDLKKAKKEYLKGRRESFIPRGSWNTVFKGLPINVYHTSEELTDSGVMGDPTAASPEKGEKILQAWAAYIAEFIEEFRKLPLEGKS
jgi:creatinine amidohydrolase